MKKSSILTYIAMIIFAACATVPDPLPSGGGGGIVPAPGGGGGGGGASDTEPYPYPVVNPTVGTLGSYPAPAEATEVPAAPAPATDCEIQASAPQAQTFSAEDGTVLAGSFYASRNCNAPVVVLFHQAGGTQADWEELAFWLQNRPDETSALPRGFAASPLGKLVEFFPAMPDDLSFAVFAIDFRGHGESAGDSAFDPAGFLQDAQAALLHAKTLTNVDPNRIITIGASLGADASVDACVTLDGIILAPTQASQGCVGALALSPGDFLGVSYTAAAATLGIDPHAATVHCVASEDDANAPELCGATIGAHHTKTIYPGGAHGIALLDPELTPNIGEVILDFLLTSLKLK